MLKKLLLTMATGTLLSSNVWADDLSGTWQQIDDKTGAAKAIIQIRQEADKSYSGTIVKVTPRPGYQARELCQNCPAPFTNQPILGMKILQGLKHIAGTGTYNHGRVIDPLAGKIYNAKIRLNSSKRRLTLRANLGVSVLGRNQTWIRID